MRARLRGRRPSPAFILSSIALFVALGGVAYANVPGNSVRSRNIVDNNVRSGDIVNDGVTGADIQGGGGRTGTIKNRDVFKSLAVAKGFATVQNQLVPGASAPIQNAGGQQTANLPGGVTASRTGVTGEYRVTFNANVGTGRFAGVDSADDLAISASAISTNGIASAVVDGVPNQDQIVLLVRTRLASNGAATNTLPFTVLFYINE